MKTKKFFLPSILLAVTIIVYIIATLVFCYKTEPEVATGEFPFSITYEYKGETKTLSGIYKCKFSTSGTIFGIHERYWSGNAEYENPVDPERPNIVESNEEELTTLAVHEHMYAGYFMGDPLYKDYYTEYGESGPAPYVEYYDYENDISLDDENRDEVLESIGFRIVDYTYAEPIENSFSFSGVRYEADNITIFVLILLIFFIVCLIFVRKDKEYQYNILDKIGIVFNFLVGILAIPFITFICFLFGIFGGDGIIDQLIYNIPPFAILCLALSVVLRRKGFSIPGFIIQFVGILPFIIVLVIDAVSYFI